MRYDDDEREVEYVTIKNVVAIGETADAVLCVFEDGKREVWIPKSRIHDDSEVFADDHEGKLVIPEWLAEREGLA
jgi:hypothetical protein